ncbi:capsule assembly Wzi family protein [Larkinella humicola]|uniref:Capsule assembly Wzi family protein n=1 Tax=Larkinella humicola TaxID=2607654 RepID=A0A5N1JRI0_9BACT|nr:capsule assembly Wzi family protein [Larkinella humicola]KAA9356922.1 capsule assembly Wzi family protein [Larkinella humicola]
MKRLACLAFGWLLTTSALAQESGLPNPIQADLELGGMGAATRQTPFWLRTNQYGIVPLQGPFATLRGQMSRDYRTDTVYTNHHRFDWGVGGYAAVNVGKSSQFLLPELYAKVRLGKFELWAGRRREQYGLGDTTLTSGFVAWSANALPIPKVQFHTPGFVPIGFLKKLVAFRLGYAHGWFNAPYIKGAYLHQKYLYGRFGKPHWKVKFYVGMNHQVQWGGHADYLKGTSFAVNGKLPSSFRDYTGLVFGLYPKEITTSQQTAFDGENRVGNHLGSIDYALEWTTSRLSTLLYYQHFYEDVSGIVYLNFPDGLWGLRFRNKSATPPPRFRWNAAVVEWLPMTSQSGPVFDQTAQYQGADNYFNHGQYREGWSYFGRTIGTPFIAPRADYTARVQQYTGGGFFPNNRVNVWYLGLEGILYRVQLNARASFSRNYGTYNQPYSPRFEQFSALLAARIPLPRFSNTFLSASFALDQGALYPTQTGLYLSVKKSW